MNQKSFLIQIHKSVPWVLTSDTQGLSFIEHIALLKMVHNAPEFIVRECDIVLRFKL